MAGSRGYRRLQGRFRDGHRDLVVYKKHYELESENEKAYIFKNKKRKVGMRDKNGNPK